MGIGREHILREAKDSHIPMSQQEVRNILAKLAQMELAKVSRGRGGSRITLKGREIWEKHKLVNDITNYNK